MPRAEGRDKPGAQVNREAELSLLVSCLLCANYPPDPWNTSTLHPTAQKHPRSPAQFPTKSQLPFLKSVGKYGFAWVCHTEVKVEGRFACEQVTHSSRAPAFRAASRPVSSWASQLGHVPSGAVACDKDGCNLMPRLALLDNYFLELCQGNIIFFIFQSCVFWAQGDIFSFVPKGWMLSAQLIQKHNLFITWYAAWGFKESSKYISFFSPHLKLSGKHWTEVLIAIFLSLLVSMKLY